jgi:NDP-sugar pyrophosphorylase family protein
LLRAEDFFDLSDFEYRDVFKRCEYVWQALSRVGAFALEHMLGIDGENQIKGKVKSGAYIDDRHAVVIGEGTVVEPGAYIQGPAIIGKNCEIRHGAYIRGDVLIGDGCVVGHASELKNAILLNGAGAPHFAYVGDSILGNRVNLGAGTKLSNVPVVSVKDPETQKRPTIRIEIDGKTYDTGLSKFGAILGDDAQTGCNSVLNPGCVVGKRTLIYPNVSLRKGLYPANAIIKLHQDLTEVERT